MCIIIDANTFSSVFDSRTQNHQDFRPVFDWIFQGKGKIVYGGTKYKQELARAQKFLRIFVELSKFRKIVEVDTKEVDATQNLLENVVEHADFDDAHILAIVIVSGCKLICSGDSRSFAFIKDKSLYPKNCKRPKIYSGLSQKHLLCDQNIAPICLPCQKSSKSLENIIIDR